MVDTSALELQNGLDLAGNLDVTAAGVTQAAGGITVAGTTSVNAGANAIDLSDANNDFVGAVSLNNAGANDVSIRDANDLVLGLSNMGIGSLVVTTAGNITQIDSLTQGLGAGDATFDSGAGDLTLDDSGNDFGTVVVTAADDVQVVDTNDLIVDGIVATGDVAVTADDSLTTSSNVTAGGSVAMLAQTGDLTTSGTVTAGTDVSLTAAAGSVDHFAAADATGGSATVSAGTAVDASGGSITSAGDTSITASNGNVQLGETDSGGTLTVDASFGDITQAAGAVTVATTTSLTAGDGNEITLGNVANAMTGTVSIDSANNAVTVANDGNLTVASNQSIASIDLTSASGNVAQATALTVAGNVAARAGADIDLSNAANSFGGSVALTSGGNAAVVDTTALDLAASTVGGNLAATSSGGDITDSGDLAVTGDSTFTASQAGSSITLDSSGNNFGGSVTFLPDDGTLQNVTVVDTSALELQNGLDLAGNLNVTAAGVSQAAGGVTVAGTTTVDSSSTISLADSNNAFGGSVALTSGGNATVVNSSALDLAASTVGGNLAATAAGDITDSGTLTVTGTSTFETTNSDITLDDANNDFQGDVLVTAVGSASVVDANDLSIGGTTGTGGAFTANAGGNLTTTTISSGGAASLGAGGNITAGGVSATGDYTAAAGGSLTQSGAASSGGSVSLTATGGDATVSGAVTAATNVAITASAAIAQSGNLTATSGDIDLTAGTNIAAGNATASNGAYTATAGGTYTQAAGTTITADDVDIDADGDMTIGGIVSDGDVNASSGGKVTQIGDILTNGGIVAVSAVTGIEMDASTRTDSTGGDISYVSTGNGNVVVALLNAGSDGAVTGAALGSPPNPSNSGSVSVTAGSGTSNILSATDAADRVNIRGQSTTLRAPTGSVGTQTVPLVLIITPDPEGDAVIDIQAAGLSFIVNPLFAQESVSSTAIDLSTRGANAATAASVQSALEEIGFVDWAGLDPDVRLVDCLEPCLKLPADQLEDDGFSHLRDSHQMIVIMTVNGIKLIPVYNMADATVAGTQPTKGGP